MIVELNRHEFILNIPYWKQERLVFRVPTETGKPVQVYNNLGTIANYTGFGSYIDIDLTDWVRANEVMIENYTTQIHTILHSGEYEVNVTWEIDIEILGLINPEKVMKPYTYVTHLPIIAPTRYIGGEDTICEVYSDYGSPNPMILQVAWGWYNSQGWNTQAISKGLHSLQVSRSYKMIEFGHTGFLPTFKIIPIQDKECDATYALVRWISFAGGTKQHVFELVKPKIAVSNAYELQPTDNEFVEIKGRMDSFVIKLDNLSPYDMWYYSDVLTSSKVEVSLDHGATFDRVQVTNNDVTLLTDGSMSNGVIEFNVNWRRYDAVIM